MPCSLLLVMHHHLWNYSYCVSRWLPFFSKGGGSSTVTLRNTKAQSIAFGTAASGCPHMLVCSCKYLTLSYILTLKYFAFSTVNLVVRFRTIRLCRDGRHEFLLVILVQFSCSMTVGWWLQTYKDTEEENTTLKRGFKGYHITDRCFGE